MGGGGGGLFCRAVRLQNSQPCFLGEFMSAVGAARCLRLPPAPNRAALILSRRVTAGETKSGVAERALMAV